MADTGINPGWYYAEGDPPGTQRYWDGSQWTAGPVPVQAPNPGAPQYDFQRVTPVKRNPWQWFQHTLRNSYADFSGRARRMEYWSFQLVNAVLGFVFAIPFLVLVGVTEEDSALNSVGLVLVGIVFLVWLVALFIPGLAVTVRRLHDTGKSGWWILIGVIPIINWIGGIVLFIFQLLDGTPRSNQYGPDPKGRG